MNRKQFIILLVLVVVIGGIGLSLYNKKSSSYESGEQSGQKLLGDFNVNDVAQIVIKEGEKELNLARTDKGWTVKERGGYPANFEQISEFVRKAQDLKVVQTLPVGPSQLGRLELAEPGKPKSGTLVQFKGDNGQVMKSFQLGVKHMKEGQGGEDQFGGGGSFPDGRYVLTDSKSGYVAVINDALTQASPDVASWLLKDFFKVEKPSSISVTFPEATNSWTVSRKSETDAWALSDPKAGEDVDTNKISGVASSLSFPSFQDVAVDAKPDVTGLDKPTVLKIETLDKFTYTINVGNKTADDNHYATITVAADFPKQREEVKDEKKEDKDKADKEFAKKKEELEEKLANEKKLEGWTFLVPKWTFESILKKRSELMVDKKDEKEAKADDAAAPLDPAIGDLP